MPITPAEATPTQNHPAATRRTASAAIALVLATVASSGPALAQTYDHLKCFKIRDEKTFSRATVDLDALAAEFGLEECTVKGRAKKFCVPVDKTVTVIEDGAVLPVGGEDLTQARLCYKLKCPKSELPSQAVTDQFGARSVSRFKAVELCTPVEASSPTTTTTTSTTTTTTVSLDDDFEGGSLDPSWNVLNPGLATIDVSGGALSLIPTASGGPNMWFNDGEGPLVYKMVTGDFDVAAVLATRDPGNIGNPPPPPYRLAGILARDPASGPGSRNTVHVALGSGSAGQGTSYEYKSTDDSVSDWMTTPTASPSGEVRLRRTGTTVEMYWRAASLDPWTLIQSFNRPDLPATVQVGMMVYSSTGPESVEALFDEIDFQ